MNLIAQTLSKTLTEVTADQLKGISYIRNSAFRNSSNLTAISLPETINKIGQDVFDFSENIANVDIERIDPYTIVGPMIPSGNGVLQNTVWFKNHSDIWIYAATGKILVGNKLSSPDNTFTIPDTVVNLWPHSCSLYTGTPTLTSVVIPDKVEIIQHDVFDGQTSLATITVGASVRYIGGYLTPGTQTTTLIFRQPAGMFIELPIAGESITSTGMAYNKTSRAISIYTDNEYIQNYDWATDGVTPTFHPLSEAPV